MMSLPERETQVSGARASETPRTEPPVLPLLLGEDEFGEVGVQLVLLVDALLLNAVPALLLGDPKGTGDVVTEVEPLLLGQGVLPVAKPAVAALPLTSLKVPDCLVVVLHLQVALAQEEVCLHRLAVQLEGMLAVGQRLVVLLQLHVAQRPVGVVHGHRGVPVLKKANRKDSVKCQVGFSGQSDWHQMALAPLTGEASPFQWQISAPAKRSPWTELRSSFGERLCPARGPPPSWHTLNPITEAPPQHTLPFRAHL
uniref:Uncharacterized protein n=1 Tax=Erpetoichthys calabaricus TaxID=27687 RepID=A0A8C4SI60_ERPCA